MKRALRRRLTGLTQGSTGSVRSTRSIALANGYSRHSSRRVRSMGFSTVARLALSAATSLGALALTILAASANSRLRTSQHYFPGRTGRRAVDLQYPLEPPPPGAPEMMTVNISDGAFFLAPGTGLEFDMTDLNALGQQVVSDRILFDNSGPAGPLGGATVHDPTFLSDDENGNLPLLEHRRGISTSAVSARTVLNINHASDFEFFRRRNAHADGADRQRLWRPDQYHSVQRFADPFGARA